MIKTFQIFIILVLIGTGIYYFNKPRNIDVPNIRIFNDTENNISNPKLDNENILSSFTDFQLPIRGYDQITLENNINTMQYNERMYYELFNDLYFKFHEKDSTETWKCINNKETGACTFYNAVLNNNELLCKNLPFVRDVASPGKYGTSYFTTYYQLSCTLSAQMMAKYNSIPDKITFCKNFGETYIQNECLIYTCESYYWGKDKPEECTQANVNSWFGIN